MKKNKKVIMTAIGTLAITILISHFSQFQFANAASESITPDKNNVERKIHLSKLKSFNKNSKSVDQYLKTLTAKELLETVSEISTEGEDSLNNEAVMMASYLKKKMPLGVHTQELDKLAKDKANNKYFRGFIIDTLTNRQSQDQIEGVMDTLISLGYDKTEDADVRAYSLLKIRKPSNDRTKKQKQDDSLLAIFNDDSSPASVKGAALTAMKRTDNPNLQDSIKKVMENDEQYDGIVLRHAVVEGAKGGFYKNIAKIKNLAEKTSNPEVYGSSLYALGLLHDEEAIKAIISVYGKHNNEDIGNYALISNQNIILNMLDTNQSKENILAAVRAVELIKLHSSVDKLQQIITNTSDIQILNEATNALNEIKAAPESSFPSNSNKWEVQ